ncbi:MFS transporter [Streptomyces sp. YIM S03343]
MTTMTTPCPQTGTPAHSSTPAGAGPRPGSSLSRVLGLRDFRLFVAGAGTSLLGDQFSLIAMPWLVLQLTRSPVALGAALALEGAPRALLMLFGGAVTDRISPRRVMQITAAVRGLLTALLAMAVATGAVQLWTVFLASALFGITAGFSVPAENSMVPQLVHTDDLQAGNSVIMGLGQLAGFVGPSAAGALIGAFAHSLTGVAVALGIDAATFAVCLLTLMRMRARHQADRPAATESSLLTSTVVGLRHLRDDTALRAVFGVLAIVNFLITGPVLVGIPLLADRRLAEGSIALGLLMSAFAVGNLFGYLTAGSLPRPSAALLRHVMLAFVAAFGAIVASLAFIPWMWLDFMLLAVLGLGNGFLAVLLITWMQARVPKEMTGRIMSLMMLAGSGLVPVSQALAGTLGSMSLPLLFILPGALVVLVAAGMPFLGGLRQLGTQLAGRLDSTDARRPVTSPGAC